jgi:hypothetical protein
LVKTIRKIPYRQRGASIPSIISFGNENTYYSAAYMLGIFLSYRRNFASLCEISMAAFYLHFGLKYGGGEISL